MVPTEGRPSPSRPYHFLILLGLALAKYKYGRQHFQVHSLAVAFLLEQVHM